MAVEKEIIQVSGLEKGFGKLALYRDFSLELKKGSVTAVTGPSGCGKTTFLRMLAGLEKQDGGRITGLPEKVAYLFQDDCLLPWLTVKQNVELVLRSFAGREERRRRTEEALRLTGLDEFSAYYPAALSGGMRRRAAIARTFAYDAELILLDEPFKGLDHRLKTEIREELQLLWRERCKTVVLVTHDLEDAVQMAKHIYLFSGRPVAAAEYRLKTAVVNGGEENI